VPFLETSTSILRDLLFPARHETFFLLPSEVAKLCLCGLALCNFNSFIEIELRASQFVHLKYRIQWFLVSLQFYNHQHNIAHSPLQKEAQYPFSSPQPSAATNQLCL
jgi:hypothetical protein